MTLEDIALQLTPGIGVKGAAHLLEVFGSAEAIFNASADELVFKARLRADLAQAIVRKKGPTGKEYPRHGGKIKKAPL